MRFSKKIKSFLRLFSPILVPGCVLLISYLIPKIPFCTLSLPCQDKANLIVNLDGTFIGVLITIFTIYVSFPLSSQIRKNFTKSKHQSIFILHIWTGTIFYMLSIFAYLLFDQYALVTILFFMGMSNFFVTAYYITVLVKYINESI